MSYIAETFIAEMDKIAAYLINIFLIAPLNWIGENWFLVLIAVLGIRFANKAIKAVRKHI